LSANDRTKIDVFKINHSSLLEGQAATIVRIANPIKMEFIIQPKIESAQKLDADKTDKKPAILTVAIAPTKVQHEVAKEVKLELTIAPKPIHIQSQLSPPIAHHHPHPQPETTNVGAFAQSTSFMHAVEQLIDSKLGPVI
jgi:hypothetical protein